jgi:hypothetical protein
MRVIKQNLDGPRITRDLIQGELTTERAPRGLPPLALLAALSMVTSPKSTALLTESASDLPDIQHLGHPPRLTRHGGQKTTRA